MEIVEVIRRWQLGESQRAIARASGVAREIDHDATPTLVLLGGEQRLGSSDQLSLLQRAVCRRGCGRWSGTARVRRVNDVRLVGALSLLPRHCDVRHVTFRLPYSRRIDSAARRLMCSTSTSIAHTKGGLHVVPKALS
jgi:hypothetical protein